MIPAQSCAFITYSTCPAAEKAVENSSNKLIIKGHRIKVLWGRSQTTLSLPSGGKKNLSNVPGLPERTYDSNDTIIS
jgi:pre-mRNA-splicing factor RBM22/SLT11